MIRLLTGVQQLDGNNEHRPSNCTTCTLHVESSVAHLLFECPALSMIQEIMWENVILTIPPALANDLEQIEINQRQIFMFSGLHSRYIKEFKDVYNALVDFVVIMVQAKQETVIN